MCRAQSEVLSFADGLSDTLRRSFPHKNNCTLHGAAGGHIVSISYRISHSDLGITENDSISGKKNSQNLCPKRNFLGSKVGDVLGHCCKMSICKLYVNFSENLSHFSKFPGR